MEGQPSTIPPPLPSIAKRKATRMGNELRSLVSRANSFSEPFNFPSNRDELVIYVKHERYKINNLLETLIRKRQEFETLYDNQIQAFESAANSDDVNGDLELSEMRTYWIEKGCETLIDNAYACIENLQTRLEELDLQMITVFEDFSLLSIKGDKVIAEQTQKGKPAKTDGNAQAETAAADRFATPRSQSVQSLEEETADYGASAVRVRGRELKLKDFHGEVSEFETFMEVFDLLVGQQSQFSDIEKLSILISCCKGDAARALRMIPLKGENYTLAIKRLREQFQPSNAVILLQRELDRLAVANEAPNSLWTTLNDVETLVQRLKSASINVDNFRTIETIVSKFPPSLQKKVREREFELGNPFSVQDLLTFLTSEVKRIVHLQSYSLAGTVEGDHKGDTHYPSRVLAVHSRKRDSPSSSRCPCCDKDHPIFLCDTFSSSSERFGRLRARKLCFICFQPDHLSRDCQKQSCSRCSGKHNKAICPRDNNKFRRRSSHNFAGRYGNRNYSSERRGISRESSGGRYRTTSRSRSGERSFRRDIFRPVTRSPSRERFVRFTKHRARSPAPRPMNHPANSGGIRRAIRRSTTPMRVNSVTTISRECENDSILQEQSNFGDIQCVNREDITRAESVSDLSEHHVYVNSMQASVPVNSRLMTVPVIMCNQYGQQVTFFALLDSGSDRSFITEDAANRLGLSPCGSENITVLSFGGERRTCDVSLYKCELFNADGDSIHARLFSHHVLTEPFRCEALLPCDLEFLLSLNINPDSLLLPSNIIIQPDILLGIDVFSRALGENSFSKILPSGLVLLKTFFGYVIAGSTSNKGSVYSPIKHREAIASNTVRSHVTQALDSEDFSELWRLESIGIRDDPDTERANAQIIRDFEKTVKIDNGRISVSFPWKENFTRLGDNYRLALSRLHQQYVLSVKDPKLWEKYCDIFRDQLSKNIIEDVPDVDGDYSVNRDRPVYYIPHHAVFKPGSNTTKVRIVLDASSKMKGELSLNDVIEQGPLILPNLCGVLLRARIGEHILIGDVEKAFHMIQLNESERDATRFLWLRDVNKPPSPENLRVMRFRRLPFGINASPFLLAQSIQWAMTNLGGTPLCKELSRNLYVDNVILTGDSGEELFDKYQDSKRLFADMAMNLREFESSARDCINSIRAVNELDVSTSASQKLLGVKWDVLSDTLILPLAFPRGKHLTKRLVLKYCHSIFDPLGFVNPLILTFRLFLQQLWLAECEWDEPLPVETVNQWNEMCEKFPPDYQIKLPRSICKKGDLSVRYELHVFVDASSRAYATCAYLRTVSGDESTPKILSCDMIMSRCRLAPVKQLKKPSSLTIPRLELTALQCGALLARYLSEQLDLSVSNINLYCDNMAALEWVQGNDKSDVYVRNRVASIRASAEFLQEKGINVRLFHVPTAQNPADCATRGLYPCDFDSQFWFQGPSFLKSPSCEFPEFKIIDEPHSDIVNVNQVITTDTPRFPFTLSCSSWLREKRASAFVLRFIKHVFRNCSEQVANSVQRCFPELKFMSSCELDTPLTSGDIKAGEMLLVRGAQSFDRKCGFSSDSGLNTHNGNRRTISGVPHGVFKDEFGLLRCSGRLHHAFLPFDTLFPLVIQPNNPITSLLIRDCHNRVGHLGVSATLAKLRERFWVPRGRRKVSRFCQSCVKCRRFSARPYQYPHSPALPPGRVTPSRPFSHVGLDYAGPFYVKLDDDSVSKRWICLFTCMSTRAVQYRSYSRENVTF